VFPYNNFVKNSFQCQVKLKHSSKLLMNMVYTDTHFENVFYQYVPNSKLQKNAANYYHGSQN